MPYLMKLFEIFQEVMLYSMWKQISISKQVKKRNQQDYQKD